MTGFGRATISRDDFDISVDLSSVNKKGFELFVSLPRDWSPMERLVAQTLKKSVARGKISVSIKVEKKKSISGLDLNEDRIKNAYNELVNIGKNLGLDLSREISIDTLLKIDEKISQTASSAPDWESAWVNVEKAVEDAAEKLDDMRKTEGATLMLDLQERLDKIDELVAQVEENSKDTVQKYKEQLLQRLANSSLNLDINDERVLKEVCIFADKCDICEEITRLKSHIAQFRDTMLERDAVGRKMDFICQEMGREINTTASKANSLLLTKLTIELKNELERIREQTQNIE